jgi:hypothetical protein
MNDRCTLKGADAQSALGRRIAVQVVPLLPVDKVLASPYHPGAMRPDWTRAGEAWLAYQFSTDKVKTLSFIHRKLSSESDPPVLKMYASSAAWFEENKTPDDL